MLRVGEVFIASTGPRRAAPSPRPIGRGACRHGQGSPEWVGDSPFDRPQVNAASDAATAVVRRLEKILTDLNLGVSAETDVFERRTEGGTGGSSLLTYRLAYGRLGGRYQIHVREDLVYQDEPGDGFDEWLGSEQLPWSSCPRVLRLRAFRELAALRQAIADKAQNLARGAELTTRQAEVLLAGLEPRPAVAEANGGGEGLAG